MHRATKTGQTETTTETEKRNRTHSATSIKCQHTNHRTDFEGASVPPPFPLYISLSLSLSLALSPFPLPRATIPSKLTGSQGKVINYFREGPRTAERVCGQQTECVHTALQSPEIDNTLGHEGNERTDRKLV